MKLDYYTKKLSDGAVTKVTTLRSSEVESHHALAILFDDQLQQGIDLDSIQYFQLSRRLNGMNPDLFSKPILLDFSVTN